MEITEHCEITELQEKCRTRISLLETEIEQLEQQLQQQEHVALGRNSENIENMRKWGIITQFAKGKTKEEVRSQIASTQEKITLMQNMTGITVSEANWKVISEEGSVVTREHSIEGSIYTTPFILKFTVEEDFASVKSDPVLSELMCMIDDRIVKFLENPFDRIVEDTDIVGFFIIMTSYMKWFEEMEEVFQHFINKYPTFVTRQGTMHNELKIESKKNHSPVFVLHWNLAVSMCHHVERMLTLSVDAPHKMIKLDKGNTLASAPNMFSLMVKTIGVERAIDTLIQLVQGG